MATKSKPKSKPFSVRLSTATQTYVEREAKRTKRSRGAVLSSLADEAMRCRMFPGIGFKGKDWDRRAWVVGTAHDVWQIVDYHRDIGSVERMVELGDGVLSEPDIRLALAYYERYPEEIDEMVAENRRPLEYWLELMPDAGVTLID